MSRQYFGTDGVRGRVGTAPMTPDFVLRLGWAAGRELAHAQATAGVRPKVVIGKDTRLSGYMFESALEAGFSAAGVDVILLGPMPTPGIAYLARTVGAQAGVVISASHNPFHDNGVKFFNGLGRKLDDALEAAIEQRMQDEIEVIAPEYLGRAKRMDDATGRYIEFCKSTYRASRPLDGLHIVLDCANGAAYNIAPHVLTEMGATVSSLAIAPDGMNINRDCGSTHPQNLQRSVLEQGADLGIALDGDADRCMLVDAQGKLVDGDEMLYIIAADRQRAGTLGGPVVGTLMTNLAIEQALRKLGADFERAKVGDRYVLERLQANGGLVGGESSGHILCLDRTTTGDGIVSALQVLAVMVEQGTSLRGLLQGVTRFPQVMINLPLGAALAADVMAEPQVGAAVAAATQTLGANGRVLLRPSGTEPLIRVMVEGQDAALIQQQADLLAQAVRSVLA